MKRQAAERLLKTDINNLTLEQLQKHRVKLIDAWRESEAFYGWKQAINHDYYCVIVSSSASGFTPKNKFLTHNLKTQLNEVEARLEKIYSSIG